MSTAKREPERSAAFICARIERASKALSVFIPELLNSSANCVACSPPVRSTTNTSGANAVGGKTPSASQANTADLLLGRTPPPACPGRLGRLLARRNALPPYSVLRSVKRLGANSQRPCTGNSPGLARGAEPTQKERRGSSARPVPRQSVLPR